MAYDKQAHIELLEHFLRQGEGLSARTAPCTMWANHEICKYLDFLEDQLRFLKGTLYEAMSSLYSEWNKDPEDFYAMSLRWMQTIRLIASGVEPRKASAEAWRQVKRTA